MSINFIFGNVDQDGKLDEDNVGAEADRFIARQVGPDSHQDLRELLLSEETANYLNQVLSTKLLETEKDDPAGTNDAAIQPVQDAVNYEDIQELADDLAPAPAPLAPSLFRPAPLLPPPSLVPSSVVSAPLPLFRAPVLMPKIEGRLKFSEVFASRVASAPQTFRVKGLPMVKDDAYDIGTNELSLFQNPQPSRYVQGDKKQAEIAKPVEAPVVKEEVVAKQTEIDTDNTTDIAMSSVVLEHWEEKILWDEEDQAAAGRNREAMKKSVK
ncbi:hypothetical protein HDU91_000170 [Kappamyces sp. JEL0680]|nr:hypothetical protein HDU91_000170 [Kappamyces sp. JEL0680]